MSRPGTTGARWPLVIFCGSFAFAVAGADELEIDDPTRPFIAAGASDSTVREEPPGLELTAVLVSASRRIAVINGRFYTEGERVNGELITAIEPGAIRLRRGDADVLIRIHRGGVVTTRTDGVQGR